MQGMTHGEVPALLRLREKETGNHRCHQETPAEALSLVKGPGAAPRQSPFRQEPLLQPHHTQSLPASHPRRVGTRLSPGPPVTGQRPLHHPASAVTSARTGQQHPDSYSVTLKTPSFQSVPMHRTKKQEDLKVHEGRHKGAASVV